MKYFTFLLFFYVFISSAKADPELKITKESVVNFIHSVDQAASTNDANLFSKYLADDIVINVTSIVGEEKSLYELNKINFLKSIEESAKIIREFSYIRDNLNITITDGVASINGEIRKEVQFGPMKLFSTTNETALLEIRGGKLVYTKIDNIQRFTQ